MLAACLGPGEANGARRRLELGARLELGGEGGEGCTSDGGRRARGAGCVGAGCLGGVGV